MFENGVISYGGQAFEIAIPSATGDMCPAILLVVKRCMDQVKTI